MTISRVLITGGAGYVGSVLVPKLLMAGYDVTVLDRFIFDHVPRHHDRLSIIRGDIRDRALVEAAVAGQDAVIHLASLSNDPECDISPALTWDINLNSFRPLVLAAGSADVKRFINASSSSVYGVKPEGVDVTEDLFLQPLTDYARYKADCEGILASYQGLGMAVCSVRPASLCGYAPRMRLDLVVNMFVAQAMCNGTIEIWGGQQKRALLHVDDMASAYLTLLDADAEQIDGKVWNVGAVNMKVMEIAEAAAAATKVKFTFHPMPNSDVRSYSISSAAIKHDLGFVPRLGIVTAIKNVVAAFKADLVPNAMTDSRFYGVRRVKELLAVGEL